MDVSENNGLTPTEPEANNNEEQQQSESRPENQIEKKREEPPTVAMETHEAEPSPEAEPIIAMNEEAPNKVSLTDRWAALSFPGKEHFKINDSGNIYHKENRHGEEKVIATINHSNWDQTIEQLKGSYEQLAKDLQQLKDDWGIEPNKLRLARKISALNKALLKAEGLGDYSPLWESFDSINQAFKQEQEANYQQRLKIVEKAEEIKTLESTKNEDWDALLEEWKQAPEIDKQQSDELWERYNVAHETYYQNRQELQRDQEKIQMQNLDLKLELCQKADEWAKSEDWSAASEAFNHLFERWKNIGFVTSKSKNDELWERFQTARNAFFDKRTAHFNQLREEEELNYEKKLKLVQEAEELKDSKDWKSTSSAMDLLMIQWKSIGRVPREKSDEIWQQFQTARDIFYQARKAAYDKRDRLREENLKLKQELVNQAIAIQDSNNWREDTHKMNDLMTQWKKIGPVPRAYNEKIWQAFISARTHFFDRKDQNREKRRQNFFRRLDSRLGQTQGFLNQLEKEQEEDQAKLKDFRQALSETMGTTDKDEELRNHLQSLIGDLEKQIPKREEKLQEVRNQLDILKEAEAEAAQRINKAPKKKGKKKPAKKESSQPTADNHLSGTKESDSTSESSTEEAQAQKKDTPPEA